jgi:hypothetical protein
MITRHILSCLVCLILLPTSALASKERVLEWSTFRIESHGVGESGPVVVTGSQTSRGIDSIRVDAFGKAFTLTEDDLAKL